MWRNISENDESGCIESVSENEQLIGEMTVSAGNENNKWRRNEEQCENMAAMK
jgi:hypothetical protein